MKKLFLILLVSMVCFTGCMNVTKETKNGTTPFPTFPTHIEFWNGGACIAEYDDAVVIVKTAYNTFWVGEPITWYIYEVHQGGAVVDTIIDSEALAIKFRGQK